MSDQYDRLVDDQPQWGALALRVLADALHNSLVNHVRDLADPDDETGGSQLADMDLWHAIDLTADEHDMIDQLLRCNPTRECCRHREGE